MEVGFVNARLARIWNETSQRVRRLDPARAHKLQRRLDQLAASNDLAEFNMLPQARCHQLKEDRDEQLSADLDGHYRLIFEVANMPVPRLADGGIDLTLVKRICVLEITNTH